MEELRDLASLIEEKSCTPPTELQRSPFGGECERVIRQGSFDGEIAGVRKFFVCKETKNVGFVKETKEGINPEQRPRGRGDWNAGQTLPYAPTQRSSNSGFARTKHLRQSGVMISSYWAWSAEDREWELEMIEQNGTRCWKWDPALGRYVAPMDGVIQLNGFGDVAKAEQHHQQRHAEQIAAQAAEMREIMQMAASQPQE